jgi:hypothetical protein
MEKKHGFPEAAADEEARRRFLARCGRFAVVTPPAMALLVTVAAKPNEALASSFLGKDEDEHKRPRRRKPRH